MSKRFINSAHDVVPDLMQGLSLDDARVALVNPSSGHAVAISSPLLSSPPPTPRVSVVSGGGSGHEPMAAGYVGEGILSGAVAGGVFASPSVPAISAMFDAVAPVSTGILVVVMNYQGDRLNFNQAVENHRARHQSCPIHMLMVGDDVALPGSDQPRGLAGTVFVLKIAGAAAAQGRSLDEVVNIAETVADNVSTFGFALEPCTIPGHSVDLERLNANEIELGMGIHGEPGAEKRELGNIEQSKFTNDLIEEVCVRLDASLHTKQRNGYSCSSLAVMVNNLGAVSQAEILIVCQAVATFIFDGKGHVLNGSKFEIRMYFGHFMTSLQMNGVSVTCLGIPDDNGETAQLLNTPTSCTAWNPGFCLRAPGYRPLVLNAGDSFSNIESDSLAVQISGSEELDGTQSRLSPQTERCIRNITAALLEKAEELGNLDRKGGDGDMGDTVSRGCNRIRSDLQSGAYACAVGNPSILCRLLATSVQAVMGGTSGMLVAIFLHAASASFDKDKEQNQSTSWRRAFVTGTHEVMKQGGAEVGDRTLVDALKPAADVFAEPERSVAEAVDAARDGYERSKNMVARRGRSSYVQQSELMGFPDPGALAIVTILSALAEEEPTT